MGVYWGFCVCTYSEIGTRSVKSIIFYGSFVEISFIRAIVVGIVLIPEKLSYSLCMEVYSAPHGIVRFHQPHKHITF